MKKVFTQIREKPPGRAIWRGGDGKCTTKKRVVKGLTDDISHEGDRKIRKVSQRGELGDKMTRGA